MAQVPRTCSPSATSVQALDPKTSTEYPSTCRHCRPAMSARSLKISRGDRNTQGIDLINEVELTLKSDTKWQCISFK